MEKESKREFARGFLKGYLGEGPAPASKATDAVLAERPMSRQTVSRAASDLGVQRDRDLRGQVVWSL